MLLHSAPDAPVLRIRYDTEGLLAAVDVASVLGEVGKGFERYAKRGANRGGLRLAVRRIEVGSLVADLVVVSAAAGVAFVQHPEALYGFIGFLADLLSIAQGVKPGRNKVADARLLEALLRPVAEGGAQQVNVFVVGDGNTITINKDAIELIKATREASLMRSTDAEEYSSEPARELAMPEPPRHLTLDGKFGTAISVKGRWYVRLEGEGGVLNPLELAPGIFVEDDRSYRFDGVWEGRNYRIRAALPLG